MSSCRTRRGLVGIGAAAVLAAVLALGGCGGDGGDGGDGGAGTATEQSATPTEEPSGSSSAQAGEAPDLCELFTADDFRTLTGKPAGGPPEEGMVVGAARGGCTYSAEAGFPMVMISAYDAGDREATLSMVDSEPVAGVGAEADWADETGLLVVVDGADWYLQVVATGDGMEFDQVRSVEAAKLVLAKL